MRICVIYGPKSRPSAKKLFGVIKERLPARHKIYRGLPTLKRLTKTRMNHIINVGNSTNFTPIGSPTIINAPERIRVSANKRMARMRFMAKKLSAPKLWLNYKDIPKQGFPVIARTTYHMKGQGLWYCTNKAEAYQAHIEGATHYIQFIRDTREFRAHVFALTPNPRSVNDFVVAKLSEKRSSEKTDTDIVKNHEHGYKFVAPKKADVNILDTVRLLAKQAVYKFGLHYGGVDVMYSLRSNTPYLLEINTTPSLTDEKSNTLDIYATRLLNMIGIEYEEEQ